MATETNTGSGNRRWLAHDVIIGLLAGAGVGAIVGLFISVRVLDNNIPTLIGAVVGAAFGVWALIRSHDRRSGFLNATVVVAWIALVGSALFIGALIVAIATFE